MGDRVHVTLSVLTEQVDQAKAFIDDRYDDTGTWKDGLLTFFAYQEVNYGDLTFLEALRAAGIAYESEWDAGCDFGEGTEFCRFTKDGEIVVKNVYEDEKSIQLSTLAAAIDDCQALRELIQKRQEEIAILPWDNQIEYGKICRTLQLIST